jgi:hypothetical protein
MPQGRFPWLRSGRAGDKMPFVSPTTRGVYCYVGRRRPAGAVPPTPFVGTCLAILGKWIVRGVLVPDVLHVSSRGQRHLASVQPGDEAERHVDAGRYP